MLDSTSIEDIKKAGAEIAARHEYLVAAFDAARSNLEQKEEEQYEQEMLAAWEEIKSEISGSAVREQLEGLKLGLYLYDAKTMFERLAHTHLDQLSAWRYDFRTFAKKMSRGKDRTTTDNYMRTARVFIAHQDAQGQPLELNIPKGVDFDPWIIKTSNLMISAHRAEIGTLTEKEWRLLADPETEQSELLQSFHEKDGKPTTMPAFREEDDVLYFRGADNEWHGIGALRHDGKNPSVERGVEILVQHLSKMPGESPRFYVDGKALFFVDNGESFLVGAVEPDESDEETERGVLAFVKGLSQIEVKE